MVPSRTFSHCCSALAFEETGASICRLASRKLTQDFISQLYGNVWDLLLNCPKEITTSGIDCLSGIEFSNCKYLDCSSDFFLVTVVGEPKRMNAFYKFLRKSCRSHFVTKTVWTLNELVAEQFRKML